MDGGLEIDNTREVSQMDIGNKMVVEKGYRRIVIEQEKDNIYMVTDTVCKGTRRTKAWLIKELANML